MENLQFRIWLESVDLNLIMAASFGAKRLFLSSLLRGVIEYGKKLCDDDVHKVMELFYNLTNKKPMDVSPELPFGSSQKKFAQDLYLYIAAAKK